MLVRMEFAAQKDGHGREMFQTIIGTPWASHSPENREQSRNKKHPLEVTKKTHSWTETHCEAQKQCGRHKRMPLSHRQGIVQLSQHSYKQSSPEPWVDGITSRKQNPGRLKTTERPCRERLEGMSLLRQLSLCRCTTTPYCIPMAQKMSHIYNFLSICQFCC